MKREPLTRELRDKLLNETFYRELSLDVRAADEDSRTVPASMSSETPVKRWFGNEILSHSSSAVNLDRAQNGALPMLWGHDTDQLLGAAEGFRLEGGVLRGSLRFSKNALRSEVWEQIREGMPLGISIGYRVDEWKETADSDDVTVTRWTLHEVSVVTVPADSTVGIGRSMIEDESMSEKTAGNPGEKLPVTAVVDKSTASFRLAFEEGKKTALQEESERRSEIELMFNQPGFDGVNFQELRRQCIDGLVSVEDSRAALLQYVGSGVVPISTLPPIQRQKLPTVPGPSGNDGYPFGGRMEHGADERDKLNTGAIRAIELRAGMVKDPALQKQYREGNEFVGLTLVEIARVCLRQAGVDARGLDAMSTVGLALTTPASFMRASPIISHGSSDFTNLLLDASNKMMMAGYTEAPETWRPFVKVMSVPDFKTANLVNRSNFGDLDAIPEHGEYKYGTMTDKKETIVIDTYGKLFSISRRAIINDDLSAFTEVPMLMGRAAARMVGDLAYGVLTTNAALNEDNLALFHATHGNLYTTTGAGAPSVSTLDTMFTGMATRTDPSGSTLNIVPRYIVTPRALENNTRVLLAATYDPAGSAGTLKPNPFSGRMDVISDARLDAFNALGWFGFADPNIMPTVVVAFLNGVETPYMEQYSAFTQDGVAFKVRLEAGADAADFRGGAYNDGAP